MPPTQFRWIEWNRDQATKHGYRFIEVIYLVDEDGTAFVIHAMPLTTRRRRG